MKIRKQARDAGLASAGLLSVAALALFAAQADSVHAGNRGDNPFIVQVTRNTVGNVYAPKLRLERAESIAFVSDGDVMGPGTATPGQREIYYYYTPSKTLQRITNTAVGRESYDVTRETDETHSARPLLVAFVSTGNLDPSVGNPEGNPEIFIRLTLTGQIRQITNTGAGVINAEPYTSDGGQCMVWRSNGNLDNNTGADAENPGVGHTNADGSNEIFMLRFDNDDTLQTWVVTQVSNGPAGTTSSEPIIGGYWFTRQCRSTTYQSTHDQLGNGSTGVHLYNYTKNSAETEQLTPAGVFHNAINPAMSAASEFARGPFVVYQANSDIMGNGSSGFEIFRFRLFRYEQNQYTFATIGESQNPVVSDGGGYIAFQSTADLIDPTRSVKGGGTPPFNADHNSEIYLTKGRRRVWQITESESCQNTFPSIHDNGQSIAFMSTCDLIPGNNPNHLPQVFLYQEVPREDPRITPANCKVAEGCCSVENDCYQMRLGRQIRPQ